MQTLVWQGDAMQFALDHVRHAVKNGAYAARSARRLQLVK